VWLACTDVRTFFHRGRRCGKAVYAEWFSGIVAVKKMVLMKIKNDAHENKFSSA